MKIVMGTLWCEGNTLTPIKTTFADFDYATGDGVFCKLKETTEYLKNNGCEIIPTIYARALPGGTVVKEDFLRLANELVDTMPSDGIEGIWLYLHGAMHVEEIGSGEEYVLKKVREKVGFDIPIALAMDFHANNKEEIASLSNCVAGFRTAPHSDREETQLRAAQMLLNCIRKKILPKPQFAKTDVVICGDAVQTAVEPLKSILDMARQMEKNIPGLMCIEVFNGQSWVDEPYMGPTFIATHETDERIAKECAQKLAKEFYDRRYDFVIPHVEVEEGIQLAMNAKEPQVFLSDAGDNTTAGATGDNAYVLNRLIKAGAKNVLLAGITDAAAVKKCYSSQIGDTLELKIGASLEEKSESAIIKGKLIHKGDMLNYTGGAPIPSATVECGDITVIITKERAPLCRPDILDSIDSNWRNFSIIAIKLGFLFPELEKEAERVILTFSPGNSTPRLQDMGMKNIRRPMFPLDDNFID